MTIKYKQSGGFAGLTLSAEIDVESLPARVAARVRQLVEKAKALHSPPSQASKAADLMTHQLTIEFDGKIHTLTFDDTNLPDALQPLIEILQRHLKRAP